MKKIKFSLDKTFSINYTPTSGAFYALIKVHYLAVCFGIFLSLLAVTPAQAGESGQEPAFAPIPDGLLLYVGGMALSALTPRSDLSTHYSIGWVVGTGATIATKEPWWGLSVGCLLGAAKEGYDARSDGVAAFDDFAYTCAAAALASYSTGSIIKFYQVRDAKMVGISTDF